MFLVSVPLIFKIALGASCGESTSKVACEISAFYNFFKNTITWYVLKSDSSRDFKKMSF